MEADRVAPSRDEEFEDLRRQVAELQASIASRNQAYIRREEELCEQIVDGTARLERTFRRQYEVQEGERRRRAEELAERIAEWEDKVAHQTREATLATVAAKRLASYMAAVEQAASAASARIQAVIEAAPASLKAQASLAQSARDEAEGDPVQSAVHVLHMKEQRLAAQRAAALVDLVPQLAEYFARQCAERAAEERELLSQHQTTKELLESNAKVFCETQEAILDAKQRLLEAETALSNAVATRKELEARLDADAVDVGESGFASSDNGGLHPVAKPSQQQAEVISALERRVLLVQADLQKVQQDLQLQTAATLGLRERVSASQQAMDDALHASLAAIQEQKDCEATRDGLEAQELRLDEEIRARAKLLQRQADTASLEAATRSSLDHQTAECSAALREERASLSRLQSEMRRTVHHALESAKLAMSKAEAERDTAAAQLLEVRQHRSTLKEKIASQQRELSRLQDRELETLQELLYVQQLLPKSHPAAQRSKVLRERLEAVESRKSAPPPPSSNVSQEDSRRLAEIERALLARRLAPPRVDSLVRSAALPSDVSPANAEVRVASSAAVAPADKQRHQHKETQPTTTTTITTALPPPSPWDEGPGAVAPAVTQTSAPASAAGDDRSASNASSSASIADINEKLNAILARRRT